MQSTSMSEEDAAYSALLTQLLSDSASTRNARVHSWIEHQYDFALSEQSIPPCPSPPSPSPSSSLGANRAHSIDRPDSPLLPRISSERPSSPCPSYDALFFPTSHPKPEDQDFEEQERLRTLRFIIQEMAHWKSQAALSSPLHTHDKHLPAPPPSPASSLTQSTSSRVVRSRSSSTCISRLPSFTSTLSSDQSQLQEIPLSLPVSVIVHGEFQHDLVLPHDHPLVNGFAHTRDDSLPRSLLHPQEHDGQYLCPAPDDKDSLQLSPTLSNFSCAHSRETSFTTPCASSPASPSSVVFSSSSCSPENVALPSSPANDRTLARDPIMVAVQERAPRQTSPGLKSAVSLSSAPSYLPVSLPQMNVYPASPSSHSVPSADLAADGVAIRLCPPKSVEYSQSRWSVATTASLTPSVAGSKPGTRSDPRTPPKEKKDKGLKTPKKRTRFISLISRFSPNRNDTSSTVVTSQTGDDLEYDSANDSDLEDKDKVKQRKLLSKKSSLASIRASFSISRASFSSQRPTMSFSVEEAPPLPTSPTLISPLPDLTPSSEVASSISTMPLSKMPSRANVNDGALPPTSHSASTVTTSQSSSQLSISDNSAASASESYISLARTTPNMSRVSLLPASSKRTSLASAVGIDPMVSTDSNTANQAASRSKIFRLTAKSKSQKTTGLKGAVTPSKLPIVGDASLSSSTTHPSRIPTAPTKFNPPAKLATVIATQSRQVPMLANPSPTSPTSKLSMPPSRPLPRAPRYITTLEKLPVDSMPSPSVSSRLPMPASTKGARVGTVKGFWKRQ